MREVVIVSACRTPIGKFNGAFASLSARDLAIAAGKEAIRRAGLAPSQVDEIAMGQLYTAMQGSLPARQVSMRIGLPARSNAVSVNQNCASGCGPWRSSVMMWRWVRPTLVWLWVWRA